MTAVPTLAVLRLPALLTALRSELSAATPGVWTDNASTSEVRTPVEDYYVPVAADRRHIARAHNVMGALLDVVESVVRLGFAS